MERIDIHIDEFMIYCQSKNLSAKTMASYEQTLCLFAKYLEEEQSLTDIIKISEKIIRVYITFIQERGKYTVVFDEKTIKTNNPNVRKGNGKKVSITTINSNIRNLKAFFSYLKNQRILKKILWKTLNN